jgi:pimeloyl-ACP methyl ester carboxylesterase
VASAGRESAPLVLLLHGFPETWWAWRAQLPELADAGYRAVAMDLRGYGGSDTTPRGYDAVTLAQDVSGVVKALGARDAVLVGHGWGGYVGWATAALQPGQVAALGAVSAPHPLTMLRPAAVLRARRAVRHLLAAQLPLVPERHLADPSSGAVRDRLRQWAAPGSAFPDDYAVAIYQAAIGRWPSSHCALEYHRWLVRSRLRADGRRFNAGLRDPLRQPVCCLTGTEDPAIPAGLVAASRSRVAGPFVEHRLPGVGHYPHEEDSGTFTRLLLDWLGALPR